MNRPSEFTVECARRIGDMLNSFSFNCKEVAQQIARTEHRTIQQSITRFCVEWLRVCAFDGLPIPRHDEAYFDELFADLEGWEIYLED